MATIEITDLTKIEIDGAKLKEARGNAGLSRSALYLGVSRQMLWNYENNLYQPSASFMSRASIYYKRPLEFFLEPEKKLPSLYFHA